VRGIGAASGSGSARPVPPLVSDEWLEEHRGDVVLLEVDEEPSVYYAGHIRDAYPLDWLDDLHHPVQRSFLDGEAFGRLMRRIGVSNDSHVVLYGDAANYFAASAYWLFRYHGHERVSLLDGGRRWWLMRGRDMTEDVPARPEDKPPYMLRTMNHEFRATRDDMLSRYVGAPPGTLVLDCRSVEEYDGKVTDMVDLPIERHRVTGHVPGAVNLSASELVDPGTGRLLPIDRLRRLYADRGVREGVDVALYCRVAERSALLWFVLHELLRHPDVRNYDGGWAEYGSLMDVPIER
jgi:thiosulfate/3-mercaptopyruvate sulfurtransferase